jgi:hypothetical protein
MPNPTARVFFHRGQVRPRATRIVLRLLLLACALVPGAQAQDEATEFKKRAAELAEQRLGGAEPNRALQDGALAILDGMVCRGLSAPGEISLEALNARLSSLVVQDPPLGESYQVLLLAPPRLFVLVANLGLAGPSAVRFYSRDAPHAAAKKGESAPCRLVGQIDQFTHSDFFDESLELVPLAASSAADEADAVFITISGRTDELRTGAFMAWRFHQGGLEKLWASEILQDSSYEITPGAFQVTFCADPDELHPRVCHRMVRERYRWESGAWSRIEQVDVPVKKP